MKRLLILVAIGFGTIAALSATASTANADHCPSYGPRYSGSNYRSYRPSYGYGRSNYGPSRSYGYRTPYYRSYGYRPYSSFNVYGRNFSFGIGF